MHERFRQLILCPEQVDMIFSREQLMGILLQIGLLGEPVNTDQNQRFFVGPNFLQHISFMGCAPAIEFQPTEPKQENQWLSFTFIQLPGQSLYLPTLLSATRLEHQKPMMPLPRSIPNSTSIAWPLSIFATKLKPMLPSNIESDNEITRFKYH